MHTRKGALHITTLHILTEHANISVRLSETTLLHGIVFGTRYS